MTVHPTDHIETGLGMDSLDRIEMQAFIESSFGVQVGADSLTSFKDVSALARHIEENKTRMEVEEIDWNRLLSQADHPSDYEGRKRYTGARPLRSCACGPSSCRASYPYTTA